MIGERDEPSSSSSLISSVACLDMESFCSCALLVLRDGCALLDGVLSAEEVDSAWSSSLAAPLPLLWLWTGAASFASVFASSIALSTSSWTSSLFAAAYSARASSNEAELEVDRDVSNSREWSGTTDPELRVATAVLLLLLLLPGAGPVSAVVGVK